MVVLLGCLLPAKMREAFSVGADSEDEECRTGEGYLNKGFLEGVVCEDIQQTRKSKGSQQIATLTVGFEETKFLRCTWNESMPWVRSQGLHIHIQMNSIMQCKSLRI